VVEDDGGIYLGDDGGTPGPSPDTDDGCTAAVNAADLNGNIAIIRRGVCTFATKIRLAQEAGAIAAIIVNNVPGDGPVVGGGEPSTPITIPSISISFEDGDALIQAINGGETIEGRVVDRGPIEDTIQKDGDFDQGIIAHEYAHGISTRLTGGRERFDCLLSQAFEEQMGEGWSDWAGLITTQKLDDTAEQPRGIGTYVLGQDVLGSGIRPARYSTDFAVNDYTYGDLPNEEITVPHGVGFIWATIIWDLHWALINEHGFDPDLYYGTGGNNIATQLVMDGLKLQTCGNVGFVDGRNAILQADQLLYGGANECIIRGVFARRGVGALALQGTSQSRLDQVEDFTINVPGGTDCEAVLSTVDFDEVVFSIYPNPADDVINIYSNKAAGDALVQIYDMNGREVFASKIDLASFPKINTSTYNTGVYIVKVSSDEITHSQKLIIR
jgi:extracellular elastinolytic metalloproteinase